MVERHIIRPSAGRMRPKTSESGIFNTNRNRPVSTSMLTRMLVPKPKNAFQSPGVHRTGRFVSDVIDVIKPSYRSMDRFRPVLAPVHALRAVRKILEEKPEAGEAAIHRRDRPPIALSSLASDVPVAAALTFLS